MRALKLIQDIRPAWHKEVASAFNPGAGMRENLDSLLENFYDLLENVIETGDPSCLDGLLATWSANQTETDVKGEPNHLTRVIKEIMQLTYTTFQNTLSADDVIPVLNASLPFFTYAFEKAAELETSQQIIQAHHEMDQMREMMEKLDHSKSDFIAIAAHELKTPLTLIEGYTTMLDEIYNRAEQDRSSEKVLLNGIHHGTDRLKLIVDDMIDVSLIDNNLLQLNFQPVWLNRLFSVLNTELEKTFRGRKLEFIFEEFPGSNKMIFGESERLLQVFRNILINAIKFTPDGGKIIVSGRELPGFIEVTITDTGIGINLEDQSLIFGKFGRLGNIATHSSGKTKFKGGGPGLGLHIAKGIIESHGGTIWVESAGYDEINHPGSTFHILIPERTEPPDSAMAKLYSALNNEQI